MNAEDTIKEFVFAKSQFSFFASDPSFKVVSCKCFYQDYILIFVYKKFQFSLESDRGYLQLIISPLSHVEEKCDLGNLLEYIHKVIENKPQKTKRHGYYESYEIQLETLASALRENLSKIESFCSEENYLKNCNALRNYMLKPIPAFSQD